MASTENEAILREFYRLFYRAKRFDEAARLLGVHFVNHHGGQRMEGPRATIDSFARFAAHAPGFDIEARRTIAQGDYVWTHSVITGLPQGRVALSVDIWRFEHGRIAEHWDVGQALSPDQDPNAFV